MDAIFGLVIEVRGKRAKNFFQQCFRGGVDPPGKYLRGGNAPLSSKGRVLPTPPPWDQFTQTSPLRSATDHYDDQLLKIVQLDLDRSFINSWFYTNHQLVATCNYWYMQNN